MNGAQDLGGMMGFGAVRPERDEPVFHAGWEKRALGLTLAAGALGRWNIDMSRHARETLHPAFYLARTYYEIWIAGLERLLEDAGLVGRDELDRGCALEAGNPVAGVLRGADVARVLAAGSPYARQPTGPPHFVVGEDVRAKVMNPSTHTRLPRYARGKAGAIEAVRGCFVYPDANAHGAGELPHWCYTVRFTGRELWGPQSDASLSVSIDAWEPYLDREIARD